MAHLDRARAARMMQAAGLDALLLLSPESFTYATGAPAGVATMWRRAGAVAAIVPADPAKDAAAVVTDLFEAAFRATSTITDIRINPIWVETGDIQGLEAASPEELIQAAWLRQGRPAGFQRPETFDAIHGFALAASLLRDRGLDTGRIGVELDSLSVNDFQLLTSALPGATLVDATDLVRRLKMIKSPAEIAHLRMAVELAEAGIVALREEIAVGVSRDALAAAWEAGARAEAARRNVGNLTGVWEYVSVGENPWTRGGVVQPGHVVEAVVGVRPVAAADPGGGGVGEEVDAEAYTVVAVDQGPHRLHPVGLVEERRDIAEVDRARVAAVRRVGAGRQGCGPGAAGGDSATPPRRGRVERGCCRPW